MKKKSYTAAMLREFDRITAQQSSQDQLKRLEARMTLVPRFVEKHGREVCQEMFAVLDARDNK